MCMCFVLVSGQQLDPDRLNEFTEDAYNKYPDNQQVSYSLSLYFTLSFEF